MNKNIRTLFRKKSENESGAIMLELIAVLSVMALMGAMLYRQVYVRNQELANVEMASEIRIVKEAFSAWLQADPAAVKKCGPGICTIDHLKGNVEDYLPVSYQDSNLINDYDLYVWCDGPDDDISCQGLVFLDPANLPEDWNFKRAARVAMLIGADGGVYWPDHGDCSSDEIAFYGSMGAWKLCLSGVDGSIPEENSSDEPTYIATTGLDVFQPEADLNVSVAIPDPWDLVLQDAMAYGKFMAGVSGGTNCYTIHHTGGSQDENGVISVGRDEINVPHNSDPDCAPAFYVDSPDSLGDQATVRVKNDLTVGQTYDNGNPTTAKMRLDKNGMIIFEEATVNDPQTGDAINYVLDPQYTSVMNDIKIMSRGGARLSEILPNYILKEQVTGYVTISADYRQNIDTLPHDNDTIQKPSCPVGYATAAVVIPTRFGRGHVILRAQEDANMALQIPIESVRKLSVQAPSATTVKVGESYETTVSAPTTSITLSPAENATNVIVPALDNSHKYSDDDTWWIEFANHDVQQRYSFEITLDEVDNQYKVIASYPEPKADKDVEVGSTLGGNPGYHERIEFTLQTYCVYKQEKVQIAAVQESDCKVKGGYWYSSKCYLSLPKDLKEISISQESGCKQKGWLWVVPVGESGRCYKISPHGGSLGGRKLSGDDCSKFKTEGTCKFYNCTWDTSKGECK